MLPVLLLDVPILSVLRPCVLTRTVRRLAVLRRLLLESNKESGVATRYLTWFCFLFVLLVLFDTPIVRFVGLFYSRYQYSDIWYLIR